MVLYNVVETEALDNPLLFKLEELGRFQTDRVIHHIRYSEKWNTIGIMYYSLDGIDNSVDIFLLTYSSEMKLPVPTWLG